MSVFNLQEQNAYLDNKIVAGLERLSQVFRILLWEEAKQHNLSPIQIQLLIFLQHHTLDKATVSYLAREFNLTKATISDAIKVLEQKALVKKTIDGNDTRSSRLQLTAKGKATVAKTENFTATLTALVGKTAEADKIVVWDVISKLIAQLHLDGIITVQRTCYRCTHYSVSKGIHFCNLLRLKLEVKNIRIDCPEFEAVEATS